MNIVPSIMQATNWCSILLDTVVSKDYGPGALGSHPWEVMPHGCGVFFIFFKIIFYKNIFSIL